MLGDEHNSRQRVIGQRNVGAINVVDRSAILRNDRRTFGNHLACIVLALLTGAISSSVSFSVKTANTFIES